MSRIAILGATSQIARDFIALAGATHDLLLYARGGHLPFSEYGKIPHGAVINFVGVGDPAKAAEMGAAIFETTLEFDNLALNYVKKNPDCRYIFLSSGVVYGDFSAPVSQESKGVVAINALNPKDYYGTAKLAAECCHRALAPLPIVDIRVFNYFSCTQNLSARFFITDMLRALKENTIFKTSSEPMMRDYLHPSDFHRLITAILNTPPANAPLDAYSRAPIDKLSLLKGMEREFGLKYELTEGPVSSVNATGAKPYYYSTNHRAADFGYAPLYSSLEGLVLEIKAMMA